MSAKGNLDLKKKLAAGILSLFLLIRLFPPISIFWAEHISLPLLKGISAVGSSFDFVLLEYLPAMIVLVLAAALLRRRFLRYLTSILCFVCILCLAVWYPLYFIPRIEYSANDAQLSALCGGIIDELNAAPLLFEEAYDSPAKPVRFPAWMDALKLNGICSFITGEALVSPKLPSAALPFVAMHERMHLEGHAAEGSANIAAWESCMLRGGDFADSARLWALRYAMGMLRRSEPALYEQNLMRMNHNTLQRYRETGGAYSPAPVSAAMRRLYSLLGIEDSMLNYEILASCLAAQLPE